MIDVEAPKKENEEDITEEELIDKIKKNKQSGRRVASSSRGESSQTQQL